MSWFGASPRARRTRTHGHALRAGLVLAGLIALIAGPWVSLPHGMAQDTEPGLRVLGPLPEPEVRGEIVAFDTTGERMFYLHEREPSGFNPEYLAVYDLTTPVPTLVADVLIREDEAAGNSQAPTWAYDPGRDVLYNAGPVVPPGATPGQGGAQVAFEIRRINLANLDQPDGEPRQDRTWVLDEMGAPGFRARGFTYAPEDDRIYLIGRYEPVNHVPGNALASFAGVGEDVTGVVAFDLGEEEIAWQRVVPECQAPGAYGVSRVAQIARSTHRDALYFFCAVGGGDLLNNTTNEAHPGEPGAVRLGIEPEATQADAAGFPVEFFPVSGDYGTTNATTVFDPTTDRLFVTSLSNKTPGAFVFDGRLSAWIGKVAAPNRGGDELAVSPETGRLYLAGDESGGLTAPDAPAGAGSAPGGFMIVTDATASPPPQGTTYALDWQSGLDLDWSGSIGWPGGDPKSERLPALGEAANVMADPTDNRIFYVSRGRKEADATRGKTDCALAEEQGIEPRDPDEDCSEDNPPETPPQRESLFPEGIWVLEDTTPLISEGDPVDHDLDTADVPEGPDTFRDLNGSTAGFGSLVRLVGGVEDLASYSSFLSATVADGIAQVSEAADAPKPNFGDRSVTAGTVRFTNLSAFGASGGAQSLRADDATRGDLDAAQDKSPQDPQSLPWQLLECSDGGSDPATRTDEVGPSRAEVTCDLGKEVVTASASHGVEGTDPDTLTVSASHFDTDVHRDPELGIVTSSVATAEGIELPIPGGGVVHLNSVQSAATTQAAGRTGTSAARWTRVIDGVRVVDADGNQQYPPADSTMPTSCATVATTDGTDDETEQIDSCQVLIDGLNSVLQTKMQFRLGDPDLVATPKGAYAQVWEPEAEFLNGQTVMGDDSRAVPALEAVIFADGTEKSRLVIHLAGVKADSLYKIIDLGVPGSSADDDTDEPTPTPSPTEQTAEAIPDEDEQVSAANLSGTGGDGNQDGEPVQVALPSQPVPTQPETIPQSGPGGPAVAPGETTTTAGRGPLALLTLPGLHAARIFGVWALFAAAFAVAMRRGLLLQTTTGGTS